MKEEIFSKFKNFNNELEKILERKTFSKDVKNILLSMFYKLEISYDDYFLVKRKCRTKQEYLFKVLENIKSCNSIEIMDYKDINNNSKYEVDFKLKKIKAVENELAILSALLELDDFQINLSEKNNLIKNSMSYVLNCGYEMENTEVIRDFNAWSWNTIVDEIKDINVNLLYQNLKIALNVDVFNKIQEDNNDLIKQIEKILNDLYGEEIAKAFLNLIYKISIIIFINIDSNERKSILKEKEVLQQEFNKIKDKKRYIEEISNKKKELTLDLKKLDLILNNQEMLQQEFETRNKHLPEYNKIFSISHLVEKLQKERKNILTKLEEKNKKVEPKTYLKTRAKLESDCNLLNDIEIKKEDIIYNYINQLQKLFIQEIFLKKIEKSSTKEELINCVYELRYYNFLPYNNKTNIKENEEFKLDIEQAEGILIKKLYDSKIINTISTSEKNDIEIVKNIFNLKIIDMEKIYIKITKQNDKYVIGTYDEKDTLEKEYEMHLKFNPKDKIKLNKKVKLFKLER